MVAQGAVVRRPRLCRRPRPRFQRHLRHHRRRQAGNTATGVKPAPGVPIAEDVPWFGLLIAIPIVAFVLSMTSLPQLRRVGRAVLLLYAIGSTLLTVGVASMAFWASGGAGIGSAIFLIMAAFPGIVAWLSWNLYRGSAKPE